MTDFVPNISLPLAASYNVRGQAGYATTFTDGWDQRKINSIYELATNALSGKQTLYLCKRPGVSKNINTFGSALQAAYLAVNNPTVGYGPTDDPWVFSVSGTDIRASDTVTTTVLHSTADQYPIYVDTTLISGVPTVVVQTGASGGSSTQRVFFSTAIGTWTEIVDADFTAITHRGKMEHMDGYAFILDASNRIYNSDINSLASWTAGSFIQKQIKWDFPRGLIKHGAQLLAMNAQSCELFLNTGIGSSSSPLSTAKDRAQDVGLDNINNQDSIQQTSYYASVGGLTYFIGVLGKNSKSKQVIVYDGQKFQAVSTPFIDAIINSVQWTSVNAVSFQGQQAVAISVGTESGVANWLMFFPKYNEWFEWRSTIFQPGGTGTWLLGIGTNSTKVFYFGATSSAKWQDDTTNYTWTHQFKLPQDDNNWKRMTMLGVIGDTARAASTLNVAFSDNDYVSFQTAKTIDMTLANKTITRGGTFRNRAIKLTHTGNLDIRLERFIARVEK